MGILQVCDSGYIIKRCRCPDQHGKPASVKCDEVCKLQHHHHKYAPPAAAGRDAALRALITDWQANGNSCELGDPTASVWHKCAIQLFDVLNER